MPLGPLRGSTQLQTVPLLEIELRLILDYFPLDTRQKQTIFSEEKFSLKTYNIILIFLQFSNIMSGR